jgi:hypothetical protein
MGMLDKVKGMLGKNSGKAQEGVDKAADVIDDKTGGQHTETIESGAEKAKDDKLDGQ